MIAFRAAIAVLACLLLTGCLFPVLSGYKEGSRHNLENGVPAFIHAGSTSREDAMLMLGEPDAVAMDESWVEYGSAYSRGGVGVTAAVPPGVPLGAIASQKIEYHRLIVRFDQRGIVSHAVFQSRKCTAISVNGNSKVKPCLDISGADISLKYHLTEKRSAFSHPPETTETNINASWPIIVKINSTQPPTQRLLAQVRVRDMRNEPFTNSNLSLGFSQRDIVFDPPETQLVKTLLEVELSRILKERGIRSPQDYVCDIVQFSTEQHLTFLYLDVTVRVQLVLKHNGREYNLAGVNTARSYLGLIKKTTERAVDESFREIKMSLPQVQ